MSSQPRSLEELLSDFKSSNTIDVDTAIESNIWARQFKQHLEKRDLQDEVNALRFLILTQPFVARMGEVNNNGSSKKSSKIKTEMKEIFLKAAELFFCEDSECQLVLSNDRLFQAFVEASQAVKEGGSLTNQHIGLVDKARNDPDVWQNGLEPKFIKFLSQTSKGAVACLLSIL